MQTLTINAQKQDDWMHQLPGYKSEVEIAKRALQKLTPRRMRKKGGGGSGNFGHAGRPGRVGGSSPAHGVRESGGQYEAGPEDFSDRYFDRTYREANDIYNESLNAGKKDYEAHFAALGYIASERGDRPLDDLLTGKVNWVNVHNSWCGSKKKYTCFTDAQRALVKKRNVELIYKELGGEVDRQTINRFIAQWSTSSNDHSVASLSIQEAAAEEFGYKLSKFQIDSLQQAKKNEAIVKAIDFTGRPPYKGNNIDALSARNEWDADQIKRVSSVTGADPHHVDVIYSMMAANKGVPESQITTPIADRPTERKILRAIYSATQKAMKKKGIHPNSEHVLYRGIEDRQLEGIKPGEKIRYKGNALESWSSDIHSAANFGKNVLAISIPASRIFSTARTGTGCLTEGEIVVMGMNDVIATVAYTHG